MFKNELHIDACMFIPFKIGQAQVWKEFLQLPHCRSCSILTINCTHQLFDFKDSVVKYSKWNLWGRKFCSNFAQRETLTNVHPAAAEAPKLRRCSVQSFCNILLLGHHHQPPTTSGTCNLRRKLTFFRAALLCFALLTELLLNCRVPDFLSKTLTQDAH